MGEKMRGKKIRRGEMKEGVKLTSEERGEMRGKYLKIEKKWNCKAVSSSILLLVVATLLIVIISLGNMAGIKKEFKKEIDNADFIDKVNFEKKQLDLVLNDIFENAVKGFKFSDGSGVFIEKFKAELNEYKMENGEYSVDNLKKVEEQLKEENLELTSDKIIFRVKINIKSGYVREEEIVDVEYGYENVMEKVFK